MNNNSMKLSSTTLPPRTFHEHENLSIPMWGFDLHCYWQAAESVDVAVSLLAIFYNLIITLLPLFMSRMYCLQGAVISSYTFGAFLVSVYSTCFNLRILVSGKQKLTHEGHVPYELIWFLCYHFMFHMHLLTWDQHHAITCYKAHRRFTKRSKLIQIEVVVWICAIVFALLEAFFIHDPLGYPDIPQVSYFRLIILLISMTFFWFGPLVLVVTWNAAVFSFLLKVTHNGYVKETPPEPERSDLVHGEVALPLEPWNQVGSREEMLYHEDPPEYDTLPDEVHHQLAYSMVNVVIVTVFATVMMLWSSYHMLAIFRVGKVKLQLYNFYEIIFCCELYISLYVIAKSLLLLNPLWWFYYRKDMCSVRQFGVTHE